MPFKDAHFDHTHIRPKSEFAEKSLRTIKIGGSKKMIVGCPRGSWKKGRCRVGMKGVTLLRPKLANNNGCGRRCSMAKAKTRRRKKYTVATAPRSLRLKWLKKAQRKRKFLSRCRAQLGLGSRPAPRRTIYRAPTYRKATWKSPWGEATRVEPRAIMPRYVSGHEDLPYATNPRWDGLSSHADQRRSSLGVKAGDTVTIVNAHGKLVKGRAVMRSSSGGWVINTGGKYGTPMIADESNITRVSAGRSRARNPELLVVSNPAQPSRRNAAMRKRRRSRRRNSWHGNRRGHRAAALKGWRKRRHNRKGKRRASRRKGSRRRKGGSKGSRRFRTWKQVVRAMGVKKGAKVWRKIKRSRR